MTRTRNFLLAIAILLGAVAAANAQATVFTFNGQTSGADVYNLAPCTADERCLYVNVFEGRFAETSLYGTNLVASVYYTLYWQQDGVNYSLEGYGVIPASAVTFVGNSQFALSLNTAGVPNFTAELCSFDSATSAYTCSPADAQLTVTLASNGFFTFRSACSTVDTFFFLREQLAGVSSSNSATGNATVISAAANVGTQVFTYTFGDINSGNNVSVNISKNQ